jgi:hypothetical protein
MGRPMSADQSAAYQDAAQWKAYLLIFGGTRFRYEPFFLSQDKGTRVITARYQGPVTLHPGQDTAAELSNLAELFLTAVEQVGLLHLLEKTPHA